MTDNTTTAAAALRALIQAEISLPAPSFGLIEHYLHALRIALARDQGLPLDSEYEPAGVFMSTGATPGRPRLLGAEDRRLTDVLADHLASQADRTRPDPLAAILEALPALLGRVLTATGSLYGGSDQAIFRERIRALIEHRLKQAETEADATKVGKK